jgi:hypothetical protein
MKILDNHKLLLNLLNCGDSLTIREIIDACPTECCGAPKTSSSSSISYSSSSSTSSSSSSSSVNNGSPCGPVGNCGDGVPADENIFTLNVYKLGLNTNSMAVHRFLSPDENNFELTEKSFESAAAAAYMRDPINGIETNLTQQNILNRFNLATANAAGLPGSLIKSTRQPFAWTTGIIQDENLNSTQLAKETAFFGAQVPYIANQHYLLNVTTRMPPPNLQIITGEGLIRFSVGNQGCFLMSRVDVKIFGLQHYHIYSNFRIDSPYKPAIFSMAVSPCRPVWLPGNTPYTSRVAYIKSCASCPDKIEFYSSKIYASRIFPPELAYPQPSTLFGNKTQIHDIAYYFGIYTETKNFIAFINTSIISVNGNNAIRYVVDVSKVPAGSEHVLGSHIFYQYGDSLPFDREYDRQGDIRYKYDAIGTIRNSLGVYTGRQGNVSSVVSGEYHNTVLTDTGYILQNTSANGNNQGYTTPHDDPAPGDTFNPSYYKWEPGESHNVKNFVTQNPTDLSTLYWRVAAGSNHTCGATASGEVKCWGRNTEGQSNAPNLPGVLGNSLYYFKDIYAFCNCSVGIIGIRSDPGSRGGMVVQWGDCPAEIPCIIQHENCITMITEDNCLINPDNPDCPCDSGRVMSGDQWIDGTGSCPSVGCSNDNPHQNCPICTPTEVENGCAVIDDECICGCSADNSCSSSSSRNNDDPDGNCEDICADGDRSRGCVSCLELNGTKSIPNSYITKLKLQDGEWFTWMEGKYGF